MLKQSECPFQFEKHKTATQTNDSQEKNSSFREFVLRKASERCIPINLPTLKARSTRQLGFLLESPKDSLSPLTSLNQINFVKKSIFGSQQTSPSKTELYKTLSELKSSTIHISSDRMLEIPMRFTPIGDQKIEMNSQFFKFNAIGQVNNHNYSRKTEQQTESLRKIQLSKKHHKTSSYQPMKSADVLIKKFIEDKFQQYDYIYLRNSSVKFSSDERLEYEANQVYLRITQDCILKSKFTGKMISHLKDIYKNLLAVGYDREMLFDPRRMRQLHAPLQLKEEQFIRFKYHFITSLMDQQIPVSLLFKGCYKIESMRPVILNEPTDFEIFGQENGISLISTLMYDKIFKDYTLSEYFKAVDINIQALKFAKLFAQLIDHTDSPNYTLEVLRERHVKYNLTHVQLANFKLYMSTTLQELNIPFKHIRNLLRKMDTYKFAILNKSSLQECIQNNGGLQVFVENFVQLCTQEPILYELIQRRGKPRFTAHCENLFCYFFRDNVKAITRRDIEAIHKNKSIISEKVFNKFREKAILSVAKLSNDPILVTDFQEDWDEITPIILGKSKRHVIRQLGGQAFISGLVQKLIYDLGQRPSIIKIFDDNESSIGNNLRCKLNLLLYNVHFYKKSEIAVLHKRLKITEQIYFEFCQSFQVVLYQIPQLSFINDLLKEYQQYIVND